MDRRFAALFAGLAVVAAGATFGTPYLASRAVAQTGTGTVVGRVVWGGVSRCPFPLAPEAVPGAPAQPVPPPTPGESPAPGMPGAEPGAPGAVEGGPGIAQPSMPWPIRPRRIPAGAVLVAVQGTSLSARTDENGAFALAGAPAGQYLTVAAGPVSAGGNAFALRPNVQVQAGQTTDIGTLYLVPPVVPGCGVDMLTPQMPGAAPGQSPEGPGEPTTPPEAPATP